uniref:EF-hand domain-containing protein n=1 Tax=Oryza punctata TaxID=4537 RepID=A0A0E0MBH6_ORYPU
MASTVFEAFDKDGDGKVSASELRGCMTAALGEDVSDEEAAAILATADTDGDGLRRMLRRLGSQHQQLGMEDCRAMICRFDLNGDGVLSFHEFRVMMLMA